MNTTNDVLSNEELKEVQTIYQTQVKHGMSSIVLNKTLFVKLLASAETVANKQILEEASNKKVSTESETYVVTFTRESSLAALEQMNVIHYYPDLQENEKTKIVFCKGGNLKEIWEIADVISVRRELKGTLHYYNIGKQI